MKLRIALIFIVPALVAGLIFSLAASPDGFLGAMIGKVVCPSGSVFTSTTSQVTFYEDGIARNGNGIAFDCRNASGNHVDNHIDLYFNLALAVAIVAPLISVLITFFSLPKTGGTQSGDVQVG